MPLPEFSIQLARRCEGLGRFRGPVALRAIGRLCPFNGPI